MLDDLELTPRRSSRQEVLPRRGCDICNNTGYKGRVGLFELMIMNDDLRDMIMRNARPTSSATLATQLRHGHAARRRACKRCFDGITTPDEVVRETILEA